MIRLLGLTVLLLWAGAAEAVETYAQARAQLDAGPAATVRAVVDGDTVILDPAPDGAAQVRLVGIQAPKLPLGREGFKAWPLSAESKRALEDLTLGKRLTLYFGDSRMDRHGRHLAHLFLDDGTWVQGRMIEDGMARVYTFPDNRRLAAAMLVRETAARTAGRGIWALRYYRPRATEAGPLLGELGTFQLVEGRVLKAARVRGKVYLNFGENWRDDFTVAFSKRAARLFTTSDLSPDAIQGKRVRVRGWLRKRNGPMIDVTHPEQVEILDGG